MDFASDSDDESFSPPSEFSQDDSQLRVHTKIPGRRGVLDSSSDENSDGEEIFHDAKSQNDSDLVTAFETKVKISASSDESEGEDEDDDEAVIGRPQKARPLIFADESSEEDSDDECVLVPFRPNKEDDEQAEASPSDDDVASEALLSSDDDLSDFLPYKSPSPVGVARAPRRRLQDDDSEGLLSDDDDIDLKDVSPWHKAPGPRDSSGDSVDDSLEVFDGFSTVAPPANNIGTRASNESDSASESEESAWDHDSHHDEYYLSSAKFKPPDVNWPNLRIPSKLYDRLYPHQKEGVQWMATLYSKQIGGILGDDMGLGKTYQTLTCIGGLMRAGTIRNALVIAPLSVLRSWEKEAQIILSNCCLPRISVIVLASDKPKPTRKRIVRDALNCTSRFPYLIITTYGLAGSDPSALVDKYESWDYVVLDEGHKIKNPSTNFSKGCTEICDNPRTNRLILTGTPIQNNLRELWSLFNWATSGQLLGTLGSFRNMFGDPIESGRDKHATNRTLQLAEQANRRLQSVLRPHFLQRLKASILTDLPEKRELVVWTHLSVKQRELYESYVANGETVRSIVSREKKSPLEALSWLKKLCGHPELVESAALKEEGFDFDHYTPRMARDDLLVDSAKLQVLFTLMKRLKKAGHRPLIFSQSTKMLDIIEQTLCDFSLGRIDGSTPERQRQVLVEEFNSNASRCDAMLLSTKATSLGLTLVGADRAIVYDPSWNPAEDCQAVDRCYRIGQKKDVTVYRFIAAGTVEEKMYEKQVHKDGIRRTVLTNSGSATERHFSPGELRQLFTLGPEGHCAFLEKFRAKHSGALLGSGNKPTLLENHGAVVGISSHDAVYSPDPEETLGSPGPFGGTPSKPTSLGRSQRALLSAGKELAFDDSDEENAAVRANTTLESVEELLARSDYLQASGKTHFALNLLLEAVEAKELKGKEKLEVHKRIAALSQSLGWLDTSSS